MLTLRTGQQDDTPTKWDTSYYSQTQAKVAPRGVYRFDSDVNLANPNTTSGEAFTEFANDRGKLRSCVTSCTSTDKHRSGVGNSIPVIDVQAECARSGR